MVMRPCCPYLPAVIWHALQSGPKLLVHRLWITLEAHHLRFRKGPKMQILASFLDVMNPADLVIAAHHVIILSLVLLQ